MLHAHTKLSISTVRTTTVLLTFLALFLCLGSFFLAEMLSDRELHYSIEEAHTANRNIALVAEENVRQTLAHADTILLLAQRDMEQAGTIHAEHRQLLEKLKGTTIKQIVATDAAGNLIFSLDPLPGALNIAHRESFTAHLQSDAHGLYIATPLISRATNQATVFLSRRLSDSQGNFAGIVAIGLDQQHLAGVFSKLDLDASSSLVLVRRDGVFLGREPNTVGFADKPDYFRNHPALKRITQGETAGVFTTNPATTADGNLRFAAFRAMDDYPLVLLAGITQADAIREALARQQQYRGVAGIFSIIILTALFVIWRQLSNQFTTGEALEASRKRFQNLFMEAPLGIALIDSLTGHIYEVNPMFAKIAGRTMQEMATIDWMSITHPDDVQADLDNMALLNAGKITGFDMEKRYIHLDGTIVWIHMTIAKVNSKDTSHLCMIEDITASKNIARELQKTLQRLNLATENGGVGIWEWDLLTNALIWNNRMHQLYDIPPDGIPTYAICCERTHPLDLAAIEVLLRDTLEKRSAFSTEFRIVTAAGALRYLYASAKVETNPAGEAQRMIGICWDQTELKEAEQAAKDSELRIRAITDSAKDAIIMINPAGLVSYWNSAAERITGFSAVEALGMLLHELIVPTRYRQAHNKGHSAFKQTGMGKIIGETIEIEACHKDGHEFLVELSISAVQLQGGWHAVGIIRDITERKRLEGEIRHLATHDALTNLPTLRLAHDRLAMALSHAHRHPSKLAVLFIDLDGFKTINDTYGHKSGDVVLKHAAAVLRSAVREDDTVARIGGDEFLIIATDLHASANAELIAEKILIQMAQPMNLNDHKQVTIGASVGIAIYPDNGESLEELIHQADTAMYEAKKRGKNCYVFVT